MLSDFSIPDGYYRPDPDGPWRPGFGGAAFDYLDFGKIFRPPPVSRPEDRFETVKMSDPNAATVTPISAPIVAPISAPVVTPISTPVAPISAPSGTPSVHPILGFHGVGDALDSAGVSVPIAIGAVFMIGLAIVLRRKS
jgi:hypothetical protein